MRHQFIVQGEMDGAEAQVEDALRHEQEGGEPAGMVLTERRGDQQVRVRPRPPSGDDIDEVEPPGGELHRVVPEPLDPDGHADPVRIGDGRQAPDPGRVVRGHAHEDRPFAGAGLRGDGGGHGSMSSGGVGSVPPAERSGG